MFATEVLTDTAPSDPDVCWVPDRLALVWGETPSTLRWTVMPFKAGEEQVWRPGSAMVRERFGTPVSVCPMADALPVDRRRRLDLFWGNPDGALVHGRLMDTDALPTRALVETQIVDLPRTVRGRPAALAATEERRNVFWREGDRIRHAWRDDRGRWDTEVWRHRTASEPDACSWADGRVDVCWIGPTGGVHHLYFAGGRWSALDDLGHPDGVTFDGTPVVRTWGVDVLDVWARASDGAVWHKWYDRGWRNWRLDGIHTRRSFRVGSQNGRFDAVFRTDEDRIAHGWWGGEAITGRTDAMTFWDFLTSVDGQTRVQRLTAAFATGRLDDRGSGIMVSPHLFMTASHVGGPGSSGTVRFFHLDQMSPHPDLESQRSSHAYTARALSWQDSGISQVPGQLGDTVLYRLDDDDGPDPIAPGVRHGYVDLSTASAALGQDVYTFWTNPASRFPPTLLYGRSRVDHVFDERGGGDLWRGRSFTAPLYTIGGSSGSATLSPQHGDRVVGVTQGGHPGTRVWVESAEFVEDHDSSGNGIVDAVEYDWAFTAVKQPVHVFTFNTSNERMRWVAVPGGTYADQLPDGRLGGHPRMTVNHLSERERRDRHGEEGWRAMYSTFGGGRAHRFSVVASGDRGAADLDDYAVLVWWSESTGDRVRARFAPRQRPGRFEGVVRLGDHEDYRLELGTALGSTTVVEQLCVIDERHAVGFGTHDERRMWEFSDECRPTAWGVGDRAGFSGAVLGPTTADWGLRNRHLAIPQGDNVQLTVTVEHVSGDGKECFVGLAGLDGQVHAMANWNGTPGQRQVVLQIGARARWEPPLCLIAGCRSRSVFLVRDVGVSILAPVRGVSGDRGRHVDPRDQQTR